MPKCLGIYIEDDVIKYSKVDRTKDILKIESCHVEFYERSKIIQTLEKIIRETFSAKDAISINISNELYNYFEVFASLNKKDKDKLTGIDFEYFCGEKGYNKESLDARTIYRNSREDPDKQKAIHISTNKENIFKTIQDFGNVKITNVMPISTSIFNLVDLGPKDENVLIVNIEKDTKVTTVIGGEIYHIDIVPEGMGEILDAINATENDLKRSYECCRNTTIYTQDMQDLQVDENEHLETIMPILYKLVTEVRELAETAVAPISKIYITGGGVAINNIDLYFQEYIQNAKCELLRPFFIGDNASLKLPIKEYMEVNSATALALDGLGYGEKDLNFKTKQATGGNITINSATIKEFFKEFTDPNKEMNAFDKMGARLAACLCIGVLGYGLVSNGIIKQINEKSLEIDDQTEAVQAQIDTMKSQTSSIDTGRRAYDQMYATLDAIKNPVTTDTDTTTEERVTIPKDAIPNLLNRIVYTIPKQVRVTSIKNTEGKTIVIEAQSALYEQLGYFGSALANNGYLLNVKTSSGQKSGGTILVTIEGELP